MQSAGGVTRQLPPWRHIIHSTMQGNPSQQYWRRRCPWSSPLLPTYRERR